MNNKKSKKGVEIENLQPYELGNNHVGLQEKDENGIVFKGNKRS